MLTQNNIREKVYTNTIVCLLLAIYCWAWDLPSRGTPLVTNIFFICKFLSIADSFLVRGGGPVHNLLSACGPCVPWTCIPCVNYTSIIHTCVLPVVSGRHPFLGITQPLWLLHIFCLLFYRAPWALTWGGGVEFDEDLPFKTECSQFSYFPHITQYSSVYLLPYTAGRSFSNGAWGRPWSVGAPECHQKLFFCYTSLAEQ